MGIDIRQIRNVAQWKVSPILRLSILFQRFGRAGRDPTMSAFAKLFTQPIYVLETTTNAWLDANGIEDKILRTTRGDSLPPTLRNTNSPESNAKSYEIFKYLLTIPVDRIHSELNTKSPRPLGLGLGFIWNATMSHGPDWLLLYETDAGTSFLT